MSSVVELERSSPNRKSRKGVIQLRIPKVVDKAARPSITRPLDLEEIIRRRAFEIYEERGKVDGYAIDDWLLAEAEVMTQSIRYKVA